jgi:hypothetical protein
MGSATTAAACKWLPAWDTDTILNSSNTDEKLEGLTVYLDLLEGEPTSGDGKPFKDGIGLFVYESSIVARFKVSPKIRADATFDFCNTIYKRSASRVMFSWIWHRR